MKFWNLIFCVGVLLYSSSGAASKVQVSAHQISFYWEEPEGMMVYRCKHRAIENLPYDWDVKCYDDQGRVVRTYSVHLALSRYERAVAPKISFELLYWITDSTLSPNLRFTGVTSWYRFKTGADLDSISVGQGVENDYARLTLTLSLL